MIRLNLELCGICFLCRRQLWQEESAQVMGSVPRPHGFSKPVPSLPPVWPQLESHPISVIQHPSFRHPRREAFRFSAVKTQHWLTLYENGALWMFFWRVADVLFCCQQLSMMMLKRQDFPQHSCQSSATVIYNKEGGGLTEELKKKTASVHFLYTFIPSVFIYPPWGHSCYLRMQTIV